MRKMAALTGVLVAWALSGEALAGGNLVVNGGFETGDFSDWNYTSVDDFSFVGTKFVHSGSYAAFFGDLQQDGGGSISQSLATNIGTTYALSFWFAGNGDSPSGFSATVGGNTVYKVTDPPYDADYKLYTFYFTATASSTLLKFTEYDNVSYINLDDVSVVTASSVPEPTSMIPLGIGMATLVGYISYRRRALADH